MFPVPGRPVSSRTLVGRYLCRYPGSVGSKKPTARTPRGRREQPAATRRPASAAHSARRSAATRATSCGRVHQVLSGRFGRGPDRARSSHSAPTELRGRIAALVQAGRSAMPRILKTDSTSVHVRERKAAQRTKWLQQAVSLALQKEVLFPHPSKHKHLVVIRLQGAITLHVDYKRTLKKEEKVVQPRIERLQELAVATGACPQRPWSVRSSERTAAWAHVVVPVCNIKVAETFASTGPRSETIGTVSEKDGFYEAHARQLSFADTQRREIAHAFGCIDKPDAISKLQHMRASTFKGGLMLSDVSRANQDRAVIIPYANLQEATRVAIAKVPKKKHLKAYLNRWGPYIRTNINSERRPAALAQTSTVKAVAKFASRARQIAGSMTWADAWRHVRPDIAHQLLVQHEPAAHVDLTAP